MKVAVVTGANIGIGKEIVRGIAAQPGWLVILCARTPIKGEAAVAALVADGISAAALAYHQLDLNDPTSITAFSAWFKETHGNTLAALVNNAGMYCMCG
jgi:NAD(P)-dependent dehydrogenase (short-subunit alcohol dehydrogenase family)